VWTIQAALLAPQDAPGLTRLGTLLMLHQRDAEAASYLARSLEIDPAQAQAASNLGLSLLNRKQYAQARSVLENALAQYPDDLHIQINLANALAQCGELAAAIDMHARVLARQPDDVHTLVNLASLEIRRHDYAQAQTYLDQALVLAPQHSGALSAQADAWRFQHSLRPVSQAACSHP
jgi:Flp pilus assembly protein TadD